MLKVSTRRVRVGPGGHGDPVGLGLTVGEDAVPVGSGGALVEVGVGEPVGWVPGGPSGSPDPRSTTYAAPAATARTTSSVTARADRLTGRG